MPDLHFQIDSAAATPHAVAPTLTFKLRVTDTAVEGLIHSVALQCQIRIEATQRRYGERDREQLRDLFGAHERWGQTVRSLLWTHVGVVVPPFTGSRIVDLPVPCTYDFNVAAAKYFYALEEGEVPLTFLFSGTVFYASESGALQVTQIPWDREATFRLPVPTWDAMMELYYPNSAWVCLRKDIFDRLYGYKTRLGLPTWEQALNHLLVAAEKGVPT